MARSIRIFIISLCTTLIAVMFISGVTVVTKSGLETSGAETEASEINVEALETALETADNFLTFFAPNIKAATHFSLIMCAALSEVY